MAERPKLGQLLIGAEVIVEGQLAAALDEQKQTGHPLGMTLVTMGFLDEETLVRTLARQLSLPIAWIRGKKIRQPVLELVPASIVGAHRCLPVRVDDQGGNKILLLAMEDPADSLVLDAVALAAGMPVRPVLAAPSELEESIQRHFPDLELVPPAAASGDASLDRELIPDLESGADARDGEEKDDACMSSLDLTGDPPNASGEPADDLSNEADDSGFDFSPDLDDPPESEDLPGEALPFEDAAELGSDAGDEVDDDEISYDDLNAANELDLDEDFEAYAAGSSDSPDARVPAEDETPVESLAMAPLAPPADAEELSETEGEGPEVLCMSDASPLARDAQSARAPAPAGVGADVILRALSQLLVEKGVIGREELIERLTQLGGHGGEDGVLEGLDAET
jgi:hypothetical protein